MSNTYVYKVCLFMSKYPKGTDIQALEDLLCSLSPITNEQFIEQRRLEDLLTELRSKEDSQE